MIERKCNQSELLKIRDLLYAKFEIPRSNSINSNKGKSIKTIEKEFLRNIKLEKDLTKELVYPNYWEKIDREELSKNPYEKFKDSRFILRSIEDKSYPNIDESSSWYRTFMYDFYERGILIWLSAISRTIAVVNNNQEWYVKNNFDNEPIQKGNYEVNIRILGKLPYEYIVHYHDGDGYYNDYHLFCKFIGIDNTPYEEIIYLAENRFGYFWVELDKSKMLEV